MSSQVSQMFIHVILIEAVSGLFQALQKIFIHVILVQVARNLFQTLLIHLILVQVANDVLQVILIMKKSNRLLEVLIIVYKS